MTEKQLNQLYDLQKEKRIWEDKLREYTDIKAVGYESTGASRSGNISSPVQQLAEQREKIREIIAAKLTEISFVEREILEWINSIDNSLIRQIMIYRHIDLKSWAQIGTALGTTPDSLRMMHRRYLDENL